MAVPTPGVCENAQRVSSVSSAQVGAVSEISPFDAELLAAAMRACDFHGDGEAARKEMRRDCLATPPHLKADLLAYFISTYGDGSSC